MFTGTANTFKLLTLGIKSWFVCSGGLSVEVITIKACVTAKNHMKEYIELLVLYDLLSMHYLLHKLFLTNNMFFC